MPKALRERDSVSVRHWLLSFDGQPMKVLPLRIRLTAIILVPLLLIAVAVGFWQVRNARMTAEDLFDRSLLTTALAVAGDVARSDGEVLSPKTSALLADTSGGKVFYHVYAPDGAFVIGYATPPVLPGRGWKEDGPEIHTATYYGRSVRLARLRDVTSIGGLSGTFTISVWQDLALREDFTRRLTSRTFVVIAALIGTVAFVVWFGVNLGLRPLLDLEEAISRRSSDDLGPIQRPVPSEARGLVTTLNRLFGQVAAAMDAQNAFVSNAAHQLRNPIAGALAMAEAVRSAPSGEAAQDRVGELVDAVQRVSDLAEKLLAFERAKTAMPKLPIDLTVVAREVADSYREAATVRSVSLTRRIPEGPAMVAGDEVMVRQALANLIDNALRHGGPGLRHVEVTLTTCREAARLSVNDDGKGIKSTDRERALARFGQVRSGVGSGLGLSIADAVAVQSGGDLAIDTDGPGIRVSMTFPMI